MYINSRDKKEVFKKNFVVPIMNFDMKSLNYEAKKIIIRPVDEDNESFRLLPTFLNMVPTIVTYFEINYENKNKVKIKEDIFENDLGVYSFDIKIKTFIDLYRKND